MKGNKFTLFLSLEFQIKRSRKVKRIVKLKIFFHIREYNLSKGPYEIKKIHY